MSRCPALWPWQSLEVRLSGVWILALLCSCIEMPGLRNVESSGFPSFGGELGGEMVHALSVRWRVVFDGSKIMGLGSRRHGPLGILQP